MRDFALEAHRVYIKALRKMTLQQKLDRVFEMTEIANQLFYENLQRAFPELSESELKNCT